jgi:hypothetical protein
MVRYSSRIDQFVSFESFKRVEVKVFKELGCLFFTPAPTLHWQRFNRKILILLNKKKKTLI